MPAFTQEQLTRAVKTLEERIGKYHEALRILEGDVAKLKGELARWAAEERSRAPQPPVAAPAPAAEPPAGPPAPAPSSIAKPAVPVAPKKVAPLEEKPKLFVKKPAVGVTEALKGSIQTTLKEKTRDAPPEPAPPPAPVSNAPATNPVAEPEPPAPPEPEIDPVLINFKAGEFLGAVLEGEEAADEVKRCLSHIEGAEPDERRNILLLLTRLYWGMVGDMAKRLLHGSLPWEKRLFIRFGMLDESLMAERMHIWNQLYLDKSLPEDSGIYYLDEWLEAVARGKYKYSMIDEMALDGAKPDPDATGALALKYEAISTYQMQRMCVGPRANLITILAQNYSNPGHENPLVTRQWLQTTMKYVQKCDCTLFRRRYKGEEFDVKGLFIITPGYGQKSGCWEPYSPGKKRTTGPRICLSLLPPRNGMEALLMGIADYRWEYAKAEAMHYWMTDGLTGSWINLFSRREQRGDLKQDFIDSYYRWVVSESRRTPKLDKKIREFFWQNIPFDDEIKQSLRTSSNFGYLLEMEEAKKKRDEEERIALEKIKAEREARRAARQAKLQG